MRKAATVLGMCFVLMCGVLIQAKEIVSNKREIDEAIKQVYPALVRIHVVTSEYYEGREQKHESAGSGTIISADGYVVTNHHVAGKAKWIKCMLTDKEEVEGTLIGTDALSDIAVIKLKPETMRKPVKEFPFAKWGDSNLVKVGDPVLAMGSPIAISQSVTYGIVSNTEMIFPELFWGYFSFRLDGEEVGTIVKWIAHDASIYGGNSGGPLVNLKGEIVGVNEIGLGLGGAIPANLAKDIALTLIKNGEIKRSSMGITIQPLLRTSAQEKGILINTVLKNSPADKAGLKPGDIIITYNNQPVTARYREELPVFNQKVFSTPVGEKIVLQISRAGKTEIINLQTEARSKARAKDEEIRNWGITARDITPIMAKELKCDIEGVFISSVRPSGPASQAKPTIQSRDIILEINNNKVKNVLDLKDVTKLITKDKDKPVPALVGFKRQGEKLLTVVEIGPEKEDEVEPEARKAWFSAKTQVFTRPLAEAMNLKNKKGVRITQLYPPLSKEKIFQIGDILTALDEQSIEASEPEDSLIFANMIRQYKAGTEVVFNVIRDNKEIKIPYKLILGPKSQRELEKYKDKDFGFTARDLHILKLMEKELSENQEGVLIETVEPGSWAVLGQLAVDDILLSVDNQKISNVGELKKLMEGLTKTKPKQVVFFVQRGIYTMYLEIQPDWEK